MLSDPSSPSETLRKVDALIASDSNSQNISDILADLDISPQKISSPQILNSTNDLIDFSAQNDSILSSCSQISPSSHFSACSFSEKSSDNNEIKSFLDSLSMKLSIHVSSLSEVIPQIQQLIIQNKSLSQRQIQEMNECQASLKDKNQKLETQHSQDIHSLSNLEKQINTLKTANSSLIENNNSLHNENKKLQTSISELHDSMESMITDMATLDKQRSKLIEITIKQNQIIQALEKLNKKSSILNQKPIEQKSIQKKVISDHNDIDDQYLILANINRQINDKLDLNGTIFIDLKQELDKIQNNSKLQPKERIIQIAQNLVNQIKQDQNYIQESDNQKKALSQMKEKYLQKCKSLLENYQDQLHFLQALTHSTDLQIAVTGNKITTQVKDELVHRCAELGQVYEDVIGVLSHENSFDNDSHDRVKIFELFQPHAMEEKLDQVLDHIMDKDDIDNQELYNLFTAQLFMNEIMKKQINEARDGIFQLKRENSSLRQQVNNAAEHDEEIENLRKILRCQEKKEMLIRKFLSNFNPEAAKSQKLLPLIKNVIQSISMKISNADSEGQNSLQQSQIMNNDPQKSESLNEKQISKKSLKHKKEEQQIEELKSKFEETTNNYNTLVKEKEENDRKQKEYLEQIDSLQLQVQNLTKCESLKDDQIKSLQFSLNEKESFLSNYEQKIESMKKNYEEEIENASKRLQTSNAKVNKLTSQVNSFNESISKIKQQRKQLVSQIEKIQAENQKHQNEKSQVQMELETKVHDFETRISQLQSENQILQSKNQQLSSENASLAIEKKSGELRIKAFDEKLSIERRNIQSQMEAKFTAAHLSQLNAFQELQVNVDQANNRLSSLLSTPYDLNQEAKLTQNKDHSNILETVSLIENEVTRLQKAQQLYGDILGDIKISQKLLNLKDGEPIHGAIENLVSIQQTQVSNYEASEKLAQKQKSEIDHLKREFSKAEDKMISLKQWESWARRVFRVIHESETGNMTNEEVRLSLEESLLSSVSNRATMYKIRSLREQKALFLRMDPCILKSSSSRTSQSIRNLIIIGCFVYRIQKLAGCLPIDQFQTKRLTNCSHKKINELCSEKDHKKKGKIPLNI